MWADHSKALGTPSVSARYDNYFCTRIATCVKDILTSFIEDPSGFLNEPLEYDEVECVCSQLRSWVTGVSIDYPQTHSICWVKSVGFVASTVPGLL